MPSRLLYLGCQPGQDVMDLQDGLNAVTAAPLQASASALLAVDGVFGNKTAARVREFQQKNGLAADGIVGPKTWTALIGLLQGVPGLQVNRTIGGSNSGPAKGVEGEPVHGKTSSAGSGGGGGKDTYGQGGGSKQGTGSGGSSSSGKGSQGNQDSGGGKQMPPSGGGAGNQDYWQPAYKGYYKSTTSSGGGKGGGGSSGGGSKGG